MSTATVVGRMDRESIVSTAGWSAIVGGLAMMMLGIPLAPLQDERSSAFTIILGLNAIQHLLLIVGLLGITRSGVASGGLGLTGIRIALLGLVVLIVAELVAMTDTAVAGAFYGLASLAMAVGLIMAGLVVRRSGRWQGWRRDVLLVTGIYVPLVLTPALMLPWYWGNFAIGLWGACWLGIGVALRQQESGPA